MGGLAAITRKATLIQQSDTSILIKPGQTKTIWVIYRNDGNTNWKNYLTQPVQLADAAMKSRLAALPSSVTAAFINSPSAFRQQADPRDIPIHRVIPTEVEGMGASSEASVLPRKERGGVLPELALSEAEG